MPVAIPRRSSESEDEYRAQIEEPRKGGGRCCPWAAAVFLICFALIGLLISYIAVRLNF